MDPNKPFDELMGECPASAPPFHFCAEFFEDVDTEALSATEKFPEPHYLAIALFEECGEVAKAIADESWDRVYAECVQVAAMACRLALEGDPTLSALRYRRGADDAN